MTLLHGIDVSFYEPKVDWPRVAASGKVDFVFVRAGQGIVSDPSFMGHWIGARNAGLPRGAYWIYDPRYAVVKPQRQAEKFVATLNGDYGELPLVADIEKYTSGPHHGWKRWADFLEYTKALLPEAWKQRWSDFEPLIIYTGFYHWRDEGGPAWWDVSAQKYFARHLLWLAFYGRKDADLTNTPQVAKLIPLHKWIEWSFWQYADHLTMDGITGENNKPTSVDTDVFVGDRDAFNKMFKLSAPLPPLPIPKTLDERVAVLETQAQLHGWSI